ncbi:mechanosensitive ion channel [Lysobacter sp. S4-A87]|uniref:mechanosensitive ion channel domain-containing protein n=1 Tax=Lysobacter sp. S4-A87 TaxID=2925843 RepID=UPI001F52F2C6|nr:mechanosensitive ion channel domain-containing protein [Lysobacter sp. S4-A87]UNK49119.1 mechanosensitive ion channel [Lysobacter sp. S4-A87]
MSRIPALLACVLCLSGMFAIPEAAAQTAPTLVETKEKGPTAIPVADIPIRADDDERFSQDVTLRATTSDLTKELSPRLATIERSVSEKAKLLVSKDLRTLPVMRLESLDRHWKFDARQYARWQSDLRQASAPFGEDAAELARRRADWEATKVAAQAGSLANALDNRIESVVAKLKQAEQALSAPLEKQIALGRRGNAVEARIQAGQKAVNQAIDYIDSRLIRLDAPPLWEAQREQRGTESALDSIRTGLEIESRFVSQYSAADLGNQRALHWLQILLLPLLVWLSFRTRKQAPTGLENEAYNRVLRRPISSWILLSMMGVLVFEPDAPLLAHQVAMLVALVPVLRLLPPDSKRLLGYWPFVATGLYLVERIGFVFLASELMYRWYYLGLTLLAMVLMLWLLLWRSRRALPGSDPAARASRIIHVIAWGATVLLAASAVSNIVGNVSLAEMLTAGVVDSGYLGLVLYAGINVFNTLLQLMIARRSASRFRIAREHAAPILGGFNKLLKIAAVLGWIAFAMSRFRIFRPVYGVVESILTYSVKFGEISVSLGHILVFAVSVFIAYWTARTVRFLLQEQVLPKMSLPRGVGNSVASLSYYALLLIGLVVALAAAGFKVGQLAFLFGALGVGIGFGLQNVVNNFVSGLILMFERPIQPGDVVEITGTAGRVREIGMRATTIKTFDGADVVVPNGTLLSEKLTNWTLLDMSRRIDIDLGVGYGSEPSQVMALLAKVTTETPHVARSPAPVVLFTGLGASSLNFAIRAWTYDFENWTNIRSELMTRVHAALREAGIEMPFPQQDMHLRSVSKDVGAMLMPQGPGRPVKPIGSDVEGDGTDSAQ